MQVLVGGKLGYQKFILGKVVEVTKKKLSTTTLTIHEVAYGLGFAHPQAFSKLFKSHTQLSPRQFRLSFSRPDFVGARSFIPRQTANFVVRYPLLRASVPVARKGLVLFG